MRTTRRSWMQVVYERCCGLDVHKKVVVACLITLTAQGQRHKEIRSFGTMTRDLLMLLDWLRAAGCTHIALESTGVYWRPIFNIFRGRDDGFAGECGAYQSGTWPKDRYQGRRVDCRSASAWVAAPQLYPTGSSTRVTGI